MEKTPNEMAEHVREAIKNANLVMEEATNAGYKIELSLEYDGRPPILVESIVINKPL